MSVVTLCGSMRFADEMVRLEGELTLAGHVVLRPVSLDLSRELTDEDRATLDRVHLQKVAMADEVLVVNVAGYVGESTRAEIEHARALGIPVRYAEERGARET